MDGPAVSPIPHSLPTRNGDAPEISVVVPLHDEQENLAELHRRLGVVLGSLGVPYEILLVDDGSRDDTARRIGQLQDSDPAVCSLHLSRNFGHQAAVSAGLDHARGRAVVVMDGDLQDPPELITRFVELWRDGVDVVYAIRRRRAEGLLKRLGYAAFYRLLKAVSEVDVPLDSGDFCLLDRRVVDALTAMPERVRFVRGLRSFVGFRQEGIPYDRPARLAGTSKYPLRSLIALAIDGLISFSGRPLRLVTYLGIASATACAILTVWALADALGSRSAPRGWASTLVVALFLGSIQLISLGIVGEYVRLIFLEVKGRPSYLVARHRGGSQPPRRRRRRGSKAELPHAAAHGPQRRSTFVP
jgi:glycosyltransferase involved in cell wall biosynthesis